MKKTLSILLTFALLCSVGSAFEGQMLGRMVGNMLGGRAVSTIIDQLKAIGGLTFYSAYDSDVDADYSLGSPTATFTADRDASHPATYCDASGVIQTTTTSNAPRYTKGYYDATGYHAGAGLLLEGASTNLIIQSRDISNVAWTKANVTTATNDTAPDGTTVVRATASNTGDSSIFQGDIDVTAEKTYVFSFFAKGGTITTPRIAIYDESNSGFIDADVTYAPSTTDYSRITHVFTTPVGCIKVRVYPLRKMAGVGTITLWGFQLEAQAYPSSFIPTTTAALTRNAEALSGPVANNFVGGTDNALRFDGTGDYVQEDAALTSAYPFTMMTRFRADDNASNRVMFSLVDASGFNVMYAMRLNTSGHVESFARNTDIRLGASVAEYDDGAWHTAVLVFASATSRKLYVDSASATEATDSVAYNTNVDRWSLGQFGDVTPGDEFEGDISEARFYNVALTPAEATNLAQGTDITRGLANKWVTSTLSYGDTEVADSVGSNDGTITDAVVVSTTHAGTILMKYRPIMLPDEQTNADKKFFYVYINASNFWALKYSTNANNRVQARFRSGGVNKVADSTAEPFGSSRYSSHTVASTFSTTTQDGDKMKMFVDGVESGTGNANYVVPIGALPASFQIQSDGLNAMILEDIALYDKRLTATEVSEADTILE